MTRISRAAVLAATVVLATPLPVSGQRPTELLIDNVHVVPMTARRVIRDQAVLVRNERIVAIGGRGTLRPTSSAAARVDAQGGFLMPGLIDAHAHLEYGPTSFTSFLNYGVTGIVNLNGSPPVLEWRAEVRSGKRAGPRILTSGPSLSGNPPGNPLFTALADTGSARAAVRHQKSSGYDLIKPYSFLAPDVYSAIMDEARIVGLPVFGHVPERVGAMATIVAGQHNIAHMEELIRTANESPAEMGTMASALRRSGGTVTANLFAYAEYLRLIPDLEFPFKQEEMRFGSAAQASTKLPAFSRARRPNPEGFARALRTRLVKFREATRIFVDSGVPVLLGTDTDIFGFAGHSAHEELRELVTAGLTPYEALTTGTSQPGAFLQRIGLVSAPLGVVAEGALADLVLVAANPLDDVANAGRIRGVVSNGRWWSAAELRAQRDSTARMNARSHAVMREFDRALTAGEGVAAVDRLRAAARPLTEPPIAESALRAYGRSLAERDARGSLAVRTLAAEWYDRSPATAVELARSLVAARDTARAVRILQNAVRVDPQDAEVLQFLREIGGRLR